MSMTSNRPYLIRAFYEWIIDNDCTPYVVVDALCSEVSVPQDFVTDGQIVLNIAPRAITELEMDNAAVSCNTRFGGVPTSIYLPMKAIMGIYARENGQGMVFQEERSPEPAQSPVGVVDSNPDSDKPPTSPGGGRKKPSLKIIK